MEILLPYRRAPLEQASDEGLVVFLE
jgi:hypothetical protein